MALLSKDEILKHAGDVETRDVHVEKWNGDVRLRSMTIREFEIHQARLSRESADGKPTGKAAAALLARCIVGDNNARLFSDGDVDTIAELGLAEVLKLTEAVNELSGIGADAESQKTVDAEIAGESDAQTSSSSSE